MLGKGLTSVFHMWTSSFPNTVCWKDCPVPGECSWHSGPKSLDHTPEGPFLGYFTGLDACLDTSTTLFWLLSLCSRFWRQERWVLRFSTCCWSEHEFGSFLLPQDCLGSSPALKIPCEGWAFPFLQNVTGLLTGTAISLHITLGVTDMGQLGVPSMNMGCVSICFCLL